MGSNKDKRTFISALFLISASSGFAVQTIKNPNVILILADDFCPGDIAAFNKGMTYTPTLDSLIHKGLYFTNAYAGSAVSAPSRACLLTGLYPHQTGCVTLGPVQFPDFTRIKKDIPTIADIFKANGYVTGLVGKWHCGVGEGYHPLDRGFDYFAGVYEFDKFKLGSYNNYSFAIQRDTVRISDCYLTDKIGQSAIDFIEQHKNSSFFLHVAHYAPHRPLGAPDYLIDKYRKKGLDKNISTLYAMVEIMDRNIGEMLNCLRENDLLQNTIIIFSSDNGPDPLVGERYNLSMKGSKYTVYEGGIKVPFIMNWQGHIPSGMTNLRLHFIDILPSLVDICNLEYDISSFEGKSFFQEIMDYDYCNTHSDRYLYWQWNRGIPYYSHNAAILKGKWKLVKPYITKETVIGDLNNMPVLYDIERDPMENTDVSHKYPEIVKELSLYLENWSRQQEILRLMK